MEKMSATVYILTFLGALLVPTFAVNGTSNSTTVISPTSSELDVASTELVDMTSSVTVGNKSDAAVDNSSTSDNVTTDIPTTPAPPNKDVTTSASDANNTTRKESKIPVFTGAPTSTSTTKSTTKKQSVTTVPASPAPQSSSVTVIVVLVVICLVVFFIILYCVCKGDRRRYSLDIHSKNEDAQIPLALVEPDFSDGAPKDMKTFTSAEEAPTPTGTVEKNEEEKADQEEKKSPAEPQTTESSAEKLDEPTDLDVSEEDTTPSTKTSVETLNDGLNENNSNNNAVRDANVCFIEICLND